MCKEYIALKNLGIMDILADKICKIYKICQSGIDPLLSWHLISSYAMDWICPGLTVDRNWNLVLSLDNRQMQEGEYPEGQEPILGILGLCRIGKKIAEWSVRECHFRI